MPCSDDNGATARRPPRHGSPGAQGPRAPEVFPRIRRVRLPVEEWGLSSYVLRSTGYRERSSLGWPPSTFASLGHLPQRSGVRGRSSEAPDPELHSGSPSASPDASRGLQTIGALGLLWRICSATSCLCGSGQPLRLQYGTGPAAWLHQDASSITVLLRVDWIDTGSTKCILHIFPTNDGYSP